MSQAKFKTRDGVGEKVVVQGDPLFCTLGNCRVRFVRLVDSTSVEVMDANTGRVLPDYRHPTQLFAY